MLTLEQVAAFATSLPGVTVGTQWGRRTWQVGDRGFAWQRPLTKADLARFGDEAPPAGEIVAVRVESLDAKDALLALDLPGFFSIEHFRGYPAVLIALKAARARDVKAALRDGHASVAAAAASSAAARPRRTARTRRARAT